MKLGEVIRIIRPPKKLLHSAFQVEGKYPVIDQSQDYIAGYSNNGDALIDVKKPLIVFGDHTCVVKYIDFPFIQGADGIKVLDAIDTISIRYLYCYMKDNPVVQYGYQRHFKELKELKILLAPMQVMVDFDNRVDDLFEKMLFNQKQVKTLESLRDTLLPKLMSGEIEIERGIDM